MEIVTAQAPSREVTALYEAHAPNLIRLAYVMLGDRPAAEDVVQEAFLGLYQRWSKLRDTASAPGYLRASVLNGCRTVLRSSARRDDRINRLGVELPWESAEATALVSEELTGKIAIGTSETTGGGRVGVMNGDKFTPLPGVKGFAAIAW